MLVLMLVSVHLCVYSDIGQVVECVQRPAMDNVSDYTVIFALRCGLRALQETA